MPIYPGPAYPGPTYPEYTDPYNVPLDSLPTIPSNDPTGGLPTTGYIPPDSLPTPESPPLAVPSNPDPFSPISYPSAPTPQPTPQPTPVDVTAYWYPWPLPPKSGTTTKIEQADADQLMVSASENRLRNGRRHGHPMRSTVRGGSKSAVTQQASAGLPTESPDNRERISSVPASPAEDLRYRGGYIIPDLAFVNLYVGGDQYWNMAEVKLIDEAIAAAMSDRRLNNVMRQYFNNAEISCTAFPSHPLTGYKPELMTQGDVEYSLSYLYENGFLKNYDLSTTVFNFLLPPGTILNDETRRRATTVTGRQNASAFRRASSTDSASRFSSHATTESAETPPLLAVENESDSTMGLGGYHGSIHKGQQTIYYSVDVYSERRSDGSTNGIPVFKESWKNIVATLYHELQEARTDPDVEDVIRNPTDPRAEQWLGWVSNKGEECGDYPIDAVKQLGSVVQEVPLADGSGMVPVQFQYSNAVHGPEGPIEQPHAISR